MEIIIVEDNSPDGTRLIAKKLIKIYISLNSLQQSKSSPKFYIVSISLFIEISRKIRKTWFGLCL